MGRASWIATVALFVGLTAWTNARAQTSNSPAVSVLLHDEVHLPTDALSRTQQEAQRIFAAAGISLVWLSTQEPPAGSLIIQIVTTPNGWNGNPNILGSAPGSKDARGRVARLFFDRIDDLARLFHLEVSQVLSHVMAHEMGHLLLPYGSHTAAGLMKAGWDNHQAMLAATGSLTFEPSQAAMIRARPKGGNSP